MIRDRQNHFPRPARRLLTALFAGGVLAAVSPSARAQQATEEGPVFGVKEKRPWLSLSPFTGNIDLIGEWVQSKADNPSTGRQKSTETLFTETLTLQTHGAIVHPNVVDFDLSGTAGFRQRDLEQSSNLGPGSKDDEIVTAFDIGVRILRNQFVSYNLFAQRSETSTSQDFGPTLLNTTTTYGAGIEIKSKVLPTKFQYTRSDTTLDDPANIQGYTQTQDSFIWQSQWNITPNSILTGSYSYNSVKEKAQLGLPLAFDTQEFTLLHTYNFGPQTKHNFTSSLDYFEQSGDLPYRHIRWEERLTLQHTANFQTFYRYTMDQNSREDVDLTSHTAEAGFRHRLFQSLSTTGSAGYIYQDTSGQQKDQEIFAHLDWDYTKKVPLGTLGLSLSLNYDYRQSEAQTEPLQIIDEPQTFTDPLGIVITRQNIDPRSIVITDAAGIRVFVPGIDYAVQSLGNRIEIRRILTGAISAGQNVLLDYIVGPQPANDQSTTAVAIGGRYKFEQGFFKGLGIYARYLYQEQSIQSDNPSFFTPDNRRDLLVGLTYDLGPLNLTAEQEWNDSTLDAYNSTRLSATYSAMVMPSLSLSLNATWSSIEYPDLNNNVTFINLMANLDYQFSRTWHARGLISYRDQKDDAFGDVSGIEAQIELEWRHRQTSVRLFLRDVELDTAGEHSSFQSLQVSIQRRF